MNQIIIAGRLGGEPETKAVGDGIEVTRISVGVSRFKKKDQDKAEVDWFECSAFGKKGAFVQKYFHKGDQIIIQGRMQSNTKDNKKYWNVFVEEVEFGAKKNGADAKPEEATDGFKQISEDDIPF